MKLPLRLLPGETCHSNLHPKVSRTSPGDAMSATRESQFEAVHICPKCGAATERKDVNPESLISGLILCSHCGQESHLNLEIRGPADKRPPTRETALNN